MIEAVKPEGALDSHFQAHIAPCAQSRAPAGINISFRSVNFLGLVQQTPHRPEPCLLPFYRRQMGSTFQE